MSKFSHSSLSRDLPDQRRRDSSRMGLLSSDQPLSSGFGRLGPSSGRISSLMDLGPSSKMGPQGSRGMMPSGSSSQNLPSILNLGSRGPPPLSSQPPRDPDQASKILASFGLSSSDLDELSRYPEEKITAENLPQIIEHLKRRRAEDVAMLRRERLSRDPMRPSRDDWDDLRPFRRESFDDRPSSLNPVVDHDHGSRSRELAYRERLDMDERLRDRERLRNDSFLSESPFRKLESNYDRLGYVQAQERSMFEKSRGMPSGRSIDDFHGLTPKVYPHLCTLCDIPCNSIKNWKEHINGGYHRKQRLLLLDLFPELAEPGMGDPYMLQQSTNPAPGLLGPPPPPGMNMRGGPDDRHGNFRGYLGHDDMPGQRPMPRKMGTGRVVHIMEFERGKNLRFQLLKLAKPFGTVASCFILNKKNEAFIEMSIPAEAHAMVDYYINKPALVFGKPVQVHMSQKYKRIKKPEGKPEGRSEGKAEGGAEQKPEAKSDDDKEPGRVIHLTNLPKTVYTDSAIIKLAETYGKVKTYILMRMRSQAFVEMEKAEDAQTMIERCAKIPLIFQGKNVKVNLSQRYKKLVLRIPNISIEKEKGRKRAHPQDQKNGAKPKQRKTDKSESSDADKSSQVVTTEDNDQTTEETDPTDLVSGSCEPELAEETGDEEATALMEMSGSVEDGAEVPDISDLDQQEMSEDQGEAQEPLSSTPAVGGRKKNTQGFHGNMEDFVTLDEVGDVEDMESHKMKLEVSEIAENETAKTGMGAEDVLTGVKTVADESATETSNLAVLNTDYELGPYQPNNPVGVDHVIPKTGYYCRLCSLFYTSEEVAKVTHCSSLAHYQKLKKILNKTAKASEKKN
ncbi:matrin-3 [Aquarana catesbeiana]|uniref:matrin-3 n=1 Tax=Aquarana catesbeiana TaxID=8400 RepID=UPI003CC9304F